MGTLILRWFFSRTVRRAVDMCRQVRKLIQAQRDLLAPEKIQEISRAARELKWAIVTGETLDDLRSRMKNLEKAANDILLPYPSASIRENVEVFLVTGAVVLALRTFFFQPMAIPSGSAQPTLWGITSQNLNDKPEVEIPGGLRRLWQACWSGIHYFHGVAEAEGELRIDPTEKIWKFVNRQIIWVGEKKYTFWFTTDPPEDLASRAGLSQRQGQLIHAGEEFIKLRVVSGDQLFVNRITYNFRHPRRGEIIVFSTHDIDRHLRTYQGYRILVENTHYIKRLIALGGEHVRIRNDRHVYINGQRLDASTPGFENVYGFDPNHLAEKDQYSGHVNDSGLAPLFPDESTELIVRPHYLLAFGDNTMNSFDGRAWGDFPEEKVVGKSSFVFWPIGGRDRIPSRFGWGYR